MNNDKCLLLIGKSGAAPFATAGIRGENMLQRTTAFGHM
jgi:hypothetical protein